MSTQQHPAAWAVFADNGNVRLWSTDHAEVRAFAERLGQPLIALYPGPPAQPAPHDDPIGNACRLLRDAAHEYAEGVSVNGVPDWKNEPDTHSAYIEHITAAHRLEQWAASIGAGGVEPLRRRECLHQIAEPARATPAAGNWIDAADVDRLVRELDVALNGEEGAAPQASLCDVVGQAKAEAAKLGRPLLAAPAARQCVECASCGSAFEVDTYMAGYTEGKGHCLNCPGINRAATEAAPAAVAGSVMARNRTKDDILHFLTKEQMVEEIIRLDAALAAAPTAQAAPVAQGDALPREDFAWLVVQEACETEPADEDDPECIRILRRDLKSAVLAAFLRHDAARSQAKEGGA